MSLDLVFLTYLQIVILIISIKFTDTEDFIPYKDSELYKKTTFVKAVKQEIQENIYISITCELLDEVVYE